MRERWWQEPVSFEQEHVGDGREQVGPVHRGQERQPCRLRDAVSAERGEPWVLVPAGTDGDLRRRQLLERLDCGPDEWCVGFRAGNVHLHEPERAAGPLAGDPSWNLERRRIDEEEGRRDSRLSGGVRPDGGTGGHNGLESIIVQLGTDKIPRLRIGIGGAPVQGAVDHVLGRFFEEEIPVVGAAIDRAVEAVKCAIYKGLVSAMNTFNSEQARSEQTEQT